MEDIAFAYLFIGWLTGAIGMIAKSEKIEESKRRKFKLLLGFKLGSQLLATFILWQK